MTHSLSEAIKQSNLLSSEQQELYVLLDAFSDSEQEQLAGLAYEYHWLLAYLYVNFAAKKYAIAKNDFEAFRRVLENQISILEPIASA